MAFAATGTKRENRLHLKNQEFPEIAGRLPFGNRSDCRWNPDASEGFQIGATEAVTLAFHSNMRGITLLQAGRF